MSIMLKKFTVPNFEFEANYIAELKRTCYNTIYPFKIFPDKDLTEINFDQITIFYGSNGSGKSTLLNVIAQKIGAVRRSPFNGSAFFPDYVKFCKTSYSKKPDNIQILTSDDVSEYVLDMRYINSGIDVKREELFEEYLENKYTNYQLKSLSDYDEWKKRSNAKRVSQSQYVKNNLIHNPDMFSNGETTMKYFLDSITENGIYLMDEPENSLAANFQLDLMKYIIDSARHFNCQFIIATHSPIFLSIPGAKIYNLDSYPVKTANWNELENVKVLQQFFKEREHEFI